MRPSLVYWTCLGAPLALALPFVLILRDDAAARNAAASALEAEAQAIEPRIADLADLNRVRAHHRMRKAAIEEMDRGDTHAAERLGFLRKLPEGVRLASLIKTNGRTTLAVDVASEADAAAVVALLVKAGYADARIATRAASTTGGLSVTIRSGADAP